MCCSQAFLPLFQQFDKNRIAAQLNPNLDPNVLKDPFKNPIEQVLDPYNLPVVGGLDSTVINPIVFEQAGAPAPSPAQP